jgi:hypothetical protein
VQAGAVLGGEPVEDGLAEQVVGEAVGPQRAGRGGQDVGGDGLLQQLPDGAGLPAGRPGQQRRAELGPGHGGRPQQLQAGRAQPGQAPPDRLPDPERDPGRRAGGQQPGHLLDEERVAAGAPLHVGHERRVGRAAEQPADQQGHLVVAERAKRRDRGGGGQVGQQGAGLLAGGLVELAPGGQDQGPGGGQAAGQEGEQLQRRRVGPLEVVEDHDQRPLPGGGQQHRGELVEQPDPGGRVRLAGLRERDRPGQLGQQPRRRGQPGGEPSQALVGRDQRPQHLHPGPVGRRPLPLPAPAPGDPGAAPLGVGGRRRGHRGLAGAGLAGQQHQPAPAGGGGLGGAAELGEQLVPPDEPVPGRHRRTILPVQPPCRYARRCRAVSESPEATSSAGVPQKTTRPPSWPAPGPRSISQSA